ncbi:MAG: hypothetical protein U0990_12740 [Candidatus Nanopelagicales bacterium]|nr:hypothetical protein [Candidatus Nanopelagicales bacterium]
MIFTLPFPPRELSPNARPHYMKRSRILGDYKNYCQILALKARREAEAQGQTFPLDPVDCYLTFVLGSKRRRDTDNLVAQFKGGIDAIVRARILTDDSSDVLTLKEPAIEYGPPAVRVRLEVRP